MFYILKTTIDLGNKKFFNFFLISRRTNPLIFFSCSLCLSSNWALKKLEVITSDSAAFHSFCCRPIARGIGLRLATVTD